jgi:hypothetical protein
MTKETYVSTSATFEFDYNIAGQRTKMVTPANETFSYTYGTTGHTEGRLQYVKVGGSTVSQYQYDGTHGRSDYWASGGGNGIYHEYDYDSAGQVSRIFIEAEAGEEYDNYSLDYEYDDAGGVTKIATLITEWEEVDEEWVDTVYATDLLYEYDDANRLTREERDGDLCEFVNQYYYDAAGNAPRTDIGIPGDGSITIPASRCWIDYDSGAGPAAGASLETVTLTRSKTGVGS